MSILPKEARKAIPEDGEGIPADGETKAWGLVMSRQKAKELLMLFLLNVLIILAFRMLER